MKSPKYPEDRTSFSTVVTFPVMFQKGTLRTLRDVSCSVISLDDYKTRKANCRTLFLLPAMLWGDWYELWAKSLSFWTYGTRE